MPDFIKDLERMIAAAPNDAVKAALETAHWKAGGLIPPPAPAPGEYVPLGLTPVSDAPADANQPGVE